MSGGQPARAHALLDILCPMHLVLGPTGHIRHAGPTIAKLLPRQTGPQRFLEAMEVKRPRCGPLMADLLAAAGKPLHLRLRHPPGTDLKGVLAPLPCGSCLGPVGGSVINLSFGISVVEAVRDFDLSNGDFAATDLAIEMLYLVEAKSAAMEASRKLNLRLEGAKIAAEEQAFTDTLTGLKNRRAMLHVLQRLQESEAGFALMNVDLDFFKTVNDTHGHAAGDHVLQAAARIMVEETRPDDTVIRAGGDEFVILFTGGIAAAQLHEIGSRLIARLETPIHFQGTPLRISGSIGVTMTRFYASPDPDRMMADADLALYAAKRAGRGRVMLYEAAMRMPG